MLLVEPRSGKRNYCIEAVCLCVCVSVRDDRDDLAWHNFANSQTIDMKLHIYDIWSNTHVLVDKLDQRSKVKVTKVKSFKNTYATAKNQEVADAAPVAQNQQQFYDYEYADMRSSLIQQEDQGHQNHNLGPYWEEQTNLYQMPKW